MYISERLNGKKVNNPKKLIRNPLLGERTFVGFFTGLLFREVPWKEHKTKYCTVLSETYTASLHTRI